MSLPLPSVLKRKKTKSKFDKLVEQKDMIPLANNADIGKAV